MIYRPCRVSPDDFAFGDALRPAEADFVEIEVGMLGADVMKDASHRALHPQIEALDRVGVNRAANIFAARMLNGLMRSETLADSDKRFPLIAHQVNPGVDLFFEHAFDFIHREIGDDRGTGITGQSVPCTVALGRCTTARTGRFVVRRRPFATTAWRWLVGSLFRPATKKELVDFDGAAERVLARQHQAQGMSNAPRCRLAYPKRLGQANGGQTLVRLQH